MHLIEYKIQIATKPTPGLRNQTYTGSSLALRIPDYGLRLEKWNRILGIICLLISILTSIKLYYQKASVRTDAGQMPDRCSFFNTV